MTDRTAVLASLDGPARVIREQEAEIGDLRGALTAARADLSAAEARIAKLEAEAVLLRAAVRQTGPINPATEDFLARRACTMTWKLRGSGPSAGRLIVSLTGARMKPVVADSADEAIGRAMQRAPIARTGPRNRGS